MMMLQTLHTRILQTLLCSSSESVPSCLIRDVRPASNWSTGWFSCFYHLCAVMFECLGSISYWKANFAAEIPPTAWYQHFTLLLFFYTVGLIHVETLAPLDQSSRPEKVQDAPLSFLRAKVQPSCTWETIVESVFDFVGLIFAPWTIKERWVTGCMKII